MKRFVYGPLQKGITFLFSFYDNQYYVLKQDPVSKYGLYFGLNQGLADDYSFFNVPTSTSTTVTIDNDGTYLYPTSDGIIWSGKGTPEVGFSYVDNVTERTGLYPSQLLLLSNPNVLRFPLKSLENEKTDQAHAATGDENYKPTYSAIVTQVFFVPLQAHSPGTCTSINSFGTYLAYSTKSGPSPFYTTVDFCNKEIKLPLCLNGAVCSVTCLGPCSEGSCIPGLSDTPCYVPERPPIKNSIWLYVVIGIVAAAILVALVVGVSVASRRKTSTTEVETIVTYE